ncbi:unnamed protein product [Effrenium voratum]|uniref:Uncharacterized protein n=1 Tax=Effrenium voratum TaxID=2562239 RepID=A0AA36J9E9_9DINO|nr:unnamed protein product [Effrenium voratum]CAJ1429112.1 unnamed protein product [Effrenium voratum]
MRLAKMAPNGAMAPWLVLLGVAGYAWCSGPCSSSGRTFQRGWTTCMADTVLHKLQLQPDPEAVRRGLRSALCLVRTEACALLVSQSRQEAVGLWTQAVTRSEGAHRRFRGRSSVPLFELLQPGILDCPGGKPGCRGAGAEASCRHLIGGLCS